MKAILLTRTGDPSVLEYVEVPTPRPKPGEVLVKADTIGVSRPELLVRRGVYPWMPPLPVIPGIEMAGTVAELGAGREPLCRRPEGLCHRPRIAGARRLLCRIHRGAGARAVRAAGGRGSGGGGVPVELSGGLASAAHRDPRRAGPERAGRLGVGRARQRRGAACQARRDDGDRAGRHRTRRRARSRPSAPIMSSTRAARMSRRGSGRSPGASASISSSTRSAARISRNFCRCSGRSACWCPTASSSARSRATWSTRSTPGRAI